jgi:Asp-tRNA(Asn)/Glu-tRNA(Gln) amidotransferase A subunit family amidase
MDVARTSGAEMARAVRDGEIGPVELFDAHAALIDELNPDLNAIVLPRLDEAREEAVAAERALASGEPTGPLHGVTFTAKECFDVVGMPAPNLGSKLLLDRPPPTADAFVVRRMREAGAILLGKTNVSEFLAFYDSVNLVYGATRNPHDRTRSAGGSSGGEAAAVASGMSPWGIGSDLGSSVRQPAHFTGVFGMRPSRDVVPPAGHGPAPSGIAFDRCVGVGPLARTADDVELLLGTIAAWPLARPPAPRRAAVYEEDGMQPVAASCRRAVRLAADALSDAGWELAEERPPDTAEVRQAYDTVVYSELAIEFGPLLEGREDELSDHGRRVTAGLKHLQPSLGSYHAAATTLVGLEVRADAWLERHELAICPVAPGPAPELGVGFTEIDGEPPRPGGLMSLSTYANALGLPSISVPATRTDAGLPVGVLVTGRRGHDLQVIKAARVLERLLAPLEPPAGCS